MIEKLHSFLFCDVYIVFGDEDSDIFFTFFITDIGWKLSIMFGLWFAMINLKTEKQLNKR